MYILFFYSWWIWSPLGVVHVKNVISTGKRKPKSHMQLQWKYPGKAKRWKRRTASTRPNTCCLLKVSLFLVERPQPRRQARRARDRERRDAQARRQFRSVHVAPLVLQCPSPTAFDHLRLSAPVLSDMTVEAIVDGTLKRMDKDNDGYIDFAEYNKVIAQ